MFRIPSFYQDAPTFADAFNTMACFGGGDALTGMEAMNTAWTDHCAQLSDEDDDFFDNYGYECNAYNVVFEGMGQLLGKAA